MYVADIYIVGRNHALVGTMFLFTILAVVAVALRVYARAVVVRNFGIDDAFSTLAAFGTIGFLVAMLEQIRYGLGDGVDYEVLPNFLQALLATIVSYTVTHFSVKLSIVFQCKRIFTERRAQRLFLSLIIYLALYGLFCFFSTIMTCWPVQKYWDASIPGGCIDRSALHYAFAGVNIVNDIMLLVSPMPFLKSLHIARRSKIVLMGVFACGSFACVVAIIRLHSLYVNNSAPIDQQPIQGVDIALWSGLEINVSIICSCVPAIKPLFVKIFPRILTSFSDSDKQRFPSGNSERIELHDRSGSDTVGTNTNNWTEPDADVERPATRGIEVQMGRWYETKDLRSNCVDELWEEDADAEKGLAW